MRRLLVSSWDIRNRLNENFLKSIDVFAKANNVEQKILLPTWEPNLEFLYSQQAYFDYGWEVITKSQDVNSNLKIHTSGTKSYLGTTLGRLKRVNDSMSLIVPGLLKNLETAPGVSGTKIVATAGSIGDLGDKESFQLWLQEVSESNKKPKVNATEGQVLSVARMIIKPSVTLIEIPDGDDKRFHITYLTYSEAYQGVLHRGILYSSKGKVERIPVDGYAWGDLHDSNKVEEYYQVGLANVKEMQPSKIFLNDPIDFESVNHHLSKQPHHTRPGKRIGLKTELEKFAQTAFDISKAVNHESELLWLESNHDYFLDSVNLDLVSAEGQADLHLYRAFMAHLNSTQKDTKRDLVKYYEWSSKVAVQEWGLPKTIKYVPASQRTMCGASHLFHGHLGIGKFRGDFMSYVRNYASCVVGHYHGPRVLGESIGLGTDLRPDIGYASNQHGWAPADAAIYKDTNQLLFKYF